MCSETEHRLAARGWVLQGGSDAGEAVCMGSMDLRWQQWSRRRREQQSGSSTVMGGSEQGLCVQREVDAVAER
ncbi:hypothetical protein M0R45_036165 [Rubus argutus]|uniref:MHC class I antigen n=1 Tax=Rubus argutus TaxID=59490 RepID=A0AAW1W0S5_RUBAR